MGTTIALFKIESHGVNNGQCFPGVSTEESPYENVVTGTGETEAEAYEDALVNIEWGWGHNMPEVLGLYKFWGDEDHDVCEECECNGDVAGCDVGCELHYYVSVWFNEVAVGV